MYFFFTFWNIQSIIKLQVILKSWNFWNFHFFHFFRLRVIFWSIFKLRLYFFIIFSKHSKYHKTIGHSKILKLLDFPFFSVSKKLFYIFRFENIFLGILDSLRFISIFKIFKNFESLENLLFQRTLEELVLWIL